jgi:hypothetical protein
MRVSDEAVMDVFRGLAWKRSDVELREAASAAIVEELLLREAGRTGTLPIPTQQALLEELQARLVMDEDRRSPGASGLKQRVAKRWHHVMEKRWLPAPLPPCADAAAILADYKEST